MLLKSRFLGETTLGTGAIWLAVNCDASLKQHTIRGDGHTTMLAFKLSITYTLNVNYVQISQGKNHLQPYALLDPDILFQ